MPDVKIKLMNDARSPAKRRGLTLVDVLAVIAIIATLAVLAAPAAKGVTRQSQIASDIAKLQKIGVAISAYREEYGPGPGIYGTASEMGLLTLLQVPTRRYGLPIESWQSSCGPMYPEADPQYRIDFGYAPADTPEFAQLARRFGDELPIVVDLSCDENLDQRLNQYKVHRGIAISLGGSLVQRLKKGDPGDMEWWVSP